MLENILGSLENVPLI